MISNTILALDVLVITDTIFDLLPTQTWSCLVISLRSEIILEMFLFYLLWSSDPTFIWNTMLC
jgi:hypothetical protein